MDKAHKKTDKILAKLEKNIEELYSDALRELKSKLNTLISRIDTTKEPQQIYNQLQQKKRLEAIIREMSLVVNNANKVAMDIMNDDMIDIYSLNYNWSAYEVEKAVAKDIGYTLYNRNAIKLLLKEEVNPFTLIAIDDLTDKTTLYKELKKALASGLLQGESMQKIASRIKKITEKNYNDSLRIARTETTRIENVGRLDSYKFAEKQGLKIQKSWLATMDKRTRESHQRVNGEMVDLDKPFSNGLMYPGDPNGGASEVIRCRCTMTTEFVGFEKGEKEKELDETLRKMSFEEWQERKEKKIVSKEEKNKIKEPKITKEENKKRTTTEEKAKKVTKKEVKNKVKFYQDKELKVMTEKQLNKVALDLAKQYYPVSGIQFGNRKVDDVIKELSKTKRSKTSLIKDIKSMQRKLKELKQ